MNLSFLKEKGNKYIVIALIGLLLVVILIPTSQENNPSGLGVVEETEDRELERQLKKVLSAMEGVGEVDVMITMENQENSLFGTTSKQGKVCGVVIVAEGAGNAVVEMRISKAVQALFAIDAHKISIVKRAK